MRNCHKSNQIAFYFSSHHATFAGSSSGAVVSLALQPLDVIRTQLQAQAVAEGKVVTRTVFTTVKDLWVEGGIRC